MMTEDMPHRPTARPGDAACPELAGGDAPACAATGLWRRLWLLPDWFLPADFPGDRRSRMRASLLIVVGPLLGISSLLWTYWAGFGLGLARPPYIAIITLTLVALANASLPLLLKRGLPLPHLSVALVTMYFAQSAAIWLFTGGETSEFLQMVPVGLVLTCFTLGLRGGILAGLGIVLLLGGMALLQDAGLVPPSRIPPDLQQVVSYYRAAITAIGALLVTASVARVNDRMEAGYAATQRRAEAGNRARSAFLANVSHELRTPITGMLGSIALLEGSPLQRQQRGWLVALRSSTESLSEILIDLLDLARQQAGERRDRPLAVAPGRFVEEVVTLFLAQAASKGIWLRCELDPDLPARLALDGAALRHVLINLTGNAIRATDQGGVTIVARCQTGRYGLLFTITVRDTGHGFDPADNPLPDPPAPGSSLVDTPPAADPAPGQPQRGRATGGLAICQRLTAAMGGYIEAFGMPQAGASFRVTVPVERLPTPDGLPPPPTRDLSPPAIVPLQDSNLVVASARRILVAEDSDTNRMLLGALLQRIGHLPILVADGTAALAAVRAAERQVRRDLAQPPDMPESNLAASDIAVPDLLLLDIQMPGLTGPEVARAVRLVPGALQQVPILGLTADATPEHRQGYLDAGMDELLYKPVQLQELQAAIDRLTRQDAAGSGAHTSRGSAAF
ncbi:MAG: response regulator [Sneathiellaceae bacterium]